jgi:dnd system-associated protein 4
MAGTVRRVRRPKDKEETVQQLLESSNGPFADVRDVITFAGMVGFAKGRRLELEKAGEAIRWDTFTNRYGTEQLVTMIAVAASDDLNIASSESVSEQILIFEEYANGGLECLAGALQQSSRFPRDVVLELVQTELEPVGTDEDPLGLRR